MPIKLRETQKTESSTLEKHEKPKRLEIRTTKLSKRDTYKKNQEIEEIKEQTDVLYDGELLPEEMKKESPVFYKLYNLAERIFPSTGLLLTFVCTALASMCTSERRQFNLLIGKETGEGGTLVISQLARIPFIRDIYDYKTAAGFVLDYCGAYLERAGRELPKGVVSYGKKGYRTFEKPGAEPIHNQFFISKGMDRLFHQGHGILEKTLNFQNPLFEEGYAVFSDGYAGSYSIGSKDSPVKAGFIGICTLQDLVDKALKTSGWIERIVVGTWMSHFREDDIIIQGINRKLLPEIDISYKVLDLLEHLNPNYPMKVSDWNEEVSKQLDKFSRFIKDARREKKGKRSARDATRIIQSLPALNRRYYVQLSDLAVMDGLMTTMRTNPTVLGWRVPFQYAIRRWFQKSDEAIRSILKTFKKWDGSPLYTEKEVIKAVKAYYGGKQNTLF